ncbi:putative family 17 glucosidase SCW4 [Fusarium oxysporum f. sp. albedinis]|nr:putative family 17 glucosidase SCW4 [Fusarium oxysporum f. sp. albedinis]
MSDQLPCSHNAQARRNPEQGSWDYYHIRLDPLTWSENPDFYHHSHPFRTVFSVLCLVAAFQFQQHRANHASVETPSIQGCRPIG